jgi:type I restriction enzyme S subunit
MSAGWKRVTLAEVAPSMGATFPAPDDFVWNLSLDEVEPVTGKVVRKTITRVSQLGSSKCAFDKRHVLYSKLRPYLNKVVLPDQPGVGTSELIPLLPSAHCLDREFLAFYLRSPRFLEFAGANTRGANLPRIAMTQFWEHSFTIPDSLCEQRRIVSRIKECMERVEEIEKLRDESIAEMKQLPPALYESIESEGNWPSKSIGEVIIGSRNGRSISQDNSNPTGFVLSLSSVRDVVLNESLKKPIKLPSSLSHEFSICKDDVFVSRANTRELVGLASIAESSHSGLIYPDLLIKLEANPLLINPRFLAYALRTRSSRLQIQERAVGSSQSMVKISAQRLKEVKIKVPPLDMQEKILDELDEARNLIFSVNREISEDQTQLLRDAILRKAFSGEL